MRKFQTMPIKFLYIDDDKKEDLQLQIDQLVNNSNGVLEIIHTNPIPMLPSLDLVTRGDFDGIIIDQKLDIPGTYQEQNYVADYFGAALAQNFRTHMAAGTAGVKSVPIILMSNERNLVDYYDPDETSHNLFDLVIKKIDLTKREVGEHYSNYMVELSNCYSLVRESSDINILLDCQKDILMYLDPRFVSYIETKKNDPYSFTFAITRTFVKSAGILANQKQMATKLGVDFVNSPDWKALCDTFKNYKYSGVFANLADRWWFVLIEDWWESQGFPSLKTLTALERVELIKEVTGLQNLSSITKKYPNQSDKYWVNCCVSDTPLDIYDAVRADCPELKMWEQPRYLDITAVLSMRATSEGYKVHPEDRYKIDILRERLAPHDK